MAISTVEGHRKPGRPKGTQKTGGRKKGTPNKLSSDVKAMILGALNDNGGQNYLAEQARENPNAFMQLVGKVLPMTVQGSGDDGEIVVRWKSS